MLSCFLVLFGEGSVLQAAAACLICLGAIKAYTLTNPFEDEGDNLLAELTQWELFFVFFAGLLIRMNFEPRDNFSTMMEAKRSKCYLNLQHQL